MQLALMPDDRPRVLNKRVHGVPAGAVYIGRPGPWGNPFRVSEEVPREQAVAKFKAWLLGDLVVPGLEQRRAWILANAWRLKGKSLVCWCAPLSCHGDVLTEFASLGTSTENSVQQFDTMSTTVSELK